MRLRPYHHRAFTIVELLIVIGIIAVLISLMAVGLRSVIGTVNKTSELNTLRQYLQAWTGYSMQADENLLPGYLSESTQAEWNVTYRDRSGSNLDRALTQTYPWRLMSYLDHSYQTVLGYSDAWNTEDINANVAASWAPAPGSFPSWMQPVLDQPGSAAALQPAFGYNAYYLGGWYAGGASPSAVFPAFTDATWQSADGSTRTGGVTATKFGQITKASELMVFTSSTYRPPGQYKHNATMDDAALGCAWVVPSFLGTTAVWQLGAQSMLQVGSAADLAPQRTPTQVIAGLLAATPTAPQIHSTDTNTMEVFRTEGVPLRRYGRQVACGYADNSVASDGMANLLDMRRWTSAAWKPDFQHSNDP